MSVLSPSMGEERFTVALRDGHVSHTTSEYINYCNANQILLMVIPPHSTHSLQPLDVVMFKPLSSAYIKELTKHLHQSRDLLGVKKSDYFSLFWRAWVTSFRKITIQKAFDSTVIYPPDAWLVLERLVYTRPGSRSPSPLPGDDDWREMDRLLASIISPEHQNGVGKQLRSYQHHLKVHHDLTAIENQGLRAAFPTKAKHQKLSEVLPLQQRRECRTIAMFWSLERSEKLATGSSKPSKNKMR